MSNFAIIRTKKLKTVQQIASASKHNMRDYNVENADTDDPKKKPLRIYGLDNAKEEFDNMMSEHNIKPRKDSVLAIEHVCSFSPEMAGKINLKKWSQDNLDFIKERYGEESILQAVLHRDEKTPHLHIMVIPIDESKLRPNVKDPKKIANFKPVKKLNAKKWLGGKRKMAALQTDYSKAMESHGLERGIKFSKAKHIDIKKLHTETDVSINMIRKRVKEMLDNEPTFLGRAKFMKKLGSEIFDLAKQTIKLQRLETESKRREKRADKHFRKLDDIRELCNCKDLDKLPDDLNNYIESSVAKQTEKLEERLFEAQSENGINACKIRTIDNTIAAKDNEIKELNNKIAIYKRKERSHDHSLG